MTMLRRQYLFQQGSVVLAFPGAVMGMTEVTLREKLQLLGYYPSVLVPVQCVKKVA